MAEETPLSKRQDIHFIWITLVLTIVIGVGAWLGVPGVLIPTALLALALVLTITYVWVMLPQIGAWRWGSTITALGVFGWLGWSFWFVFVVRSRILFVTGLAHPSGGEEVRFVVELKNQGKATSLLRWRATLTAPDGKVYESTPLTMTGDSIEIEGADRQKIRYALPDCDLRFETVRALQTGDAAYGVIDVRFPTYPSVPIPLDTKVQLTAVDVLDRTIKTGQTVIGSINDAAPDIVPCRTIESPK